MKGNLISAAIIISASMSGLIGCDSQISGNAEASPPVKAEALKSAAAATSEKKQTQETPQADASAIADAKMNVYIKCFNALQLPVNRSLSYYAGWLRDFRKGPTGNERLVYGIYQINPSAITNCQSEMKRVLALNPKLDPIDSVAGNYLDTATALANTINEMERYYTQEDYKDDHFAKGKKIHQTLLKNISAFEPVADKYHLAMLKINDKRQLVELEKIEASQGKTFRYYALAVMLSAKQINKIIAVDNFDSEAAMKKIDEMSALVRALKGSDVGQRNFPYVNSAGAYQLAAKKYVRRIRDKVAFTEDEKEELQVPIGAWMVKDSYPSALKKYNEMVDDYNRLQ